MEDRRIEIPDDNDDRDPGYDPDDEDEESDYLD
jgi:hypothetical protein